MEEVKGNKENIVVCLNCGTECYDKFCPHCGQPTSMPAKLKMKNFGKSLIMSFGRFTPGYFTTAKGLLFHPWTVLRDHIHGRRVRYSPPVTMVIQVFLYATILYTFIDVLFGSSLMREYDLNGGMFHLDKMKNVNPLLVMLDQSVVLQSLFMAVPISLIIYIAYFRHGARKYNFAEYLSAYLYMYATVVLYDIIFGLICSIPGINIGSEYMTGSVLLIFSIIILIKAFPQDKWWKHVLLLSLTGFLCLLSIFIFALILAYVFRFSPEMVRNFFK